MRLVDTLIVFRIMKMLTTPFEKTQAFKFGFIDRTGKRIKEIDGQPNNPESKKEKDSMTPLHRLVFNLKKIIEKVPFGKSQFASYAVALALLKEECNLDSDEANDLCEKFYRHIKKQPNFTPDLIVEGAQLQDVKVNHIYKLKRPLENDDQEFTTHSDITLITEHSIILGVKVYVGFIGEERFLVTADDIY